MTNRPPLKVAVVGGSIAGLATALTLSCIGCEVDVYERSSHNLRGHGGGIVILRHMLNYLMAHGLATREALSIPLKERRFIDADGRLIRSEEESLPFTSWDAVYRSLCATFPRERIHYGWELTGFMQSNDAVQAQFGNGESVQVDLLVGADGIGSKVRRILFPQVVPRFAGYVGWRGILPEAAIPTATANELAHNFTLHEGAGSLFMTFLIPGEEGSLAPGHRRFNWIWYRNISRDEEARTFLTDAHGHVHHSSVEPGQLSEISIQQLHAWADTQLPSALQPLVTRTSNPFLQAIFDLRSPTFSSGRVCLVGDAACIVRPHTASGTSKAADDATGLAEALKSPEGNLTAALSSWSVKRMAAVEHLLVKGPELARKLHLGESE